MKHPLASACRYIFQHGPVSILVYSTEHDFSKGSPQWNFVQSALASVDRRVTPWLFVAGHRPMYINSVDNAPPDGDLIVGAELLTAFEDLFKEYAVDVTMHGHHHVYERTCPVYNFTCQGYDADGVAKAPVYLVIGNAGRSISKPTGQPTPAVRPVHPACSWNSWCMHACALSRTVRSVSVITLSGAQG